MTTTMKRIMLQGFHIKEHKGEKVLFYEAKLLYPLYHSKKSIPLKVKYKIEALASDLITYSPFAAKEPLNHTNKFLLLESRLKLIFNELIRLNELRDKINDVVQFNFNYPNYKYTSIQMTEGNEGELSFHVSFMNNLPTSRSKLTYKKSYGAVAMISNKLLKYVDFSYLDDLALLYQKYILLAK